MQEVKVKRLELLEKVRENRAKHVAAYEEAVAGYKDEAIQAITRATERLKRQVEDLRAGEVLRLGTVQFDLALPQNHAKDYDQVIAMLEMSVDDELSVRSDEFACYVMDDWDWKHDFEATNVRYTSKKF